MHATLGDTSRFGGWNPSFGGFGGSVGSVPNAPELRSASHQRASHPHKLTTQIAREIEGLPHGDQHATNPHESREARHAVAVNHLVDRVKELKVRANGVGPMAL